MNAKQLADKSGMLSHDEIDLLQDCVKRLSLKITTFSDIEWEKGGESKELRISGYGDVFTSRQPITIVNIGANIGTSSCAILEANPNAFVFSIDVKPWSEERENIIACGLNPKRIIRLLGDSAEIGTFFPYRPDIVFVDGGHHDEAVRGDIEAWKDKCKSIMLFHDFEHPRYETKPNVHLDEIVTKAMKGWEVIGQARYLIAYRRPIKGPS